MPRRRRQRVAELRVVRKNLEILAPHPDNPRIHGEPGSPEWELLKQSLQHDYFDPLVWNERNGMLVSGHFRKKVMLEMGIEEADVVVVDYDEDTHKARMIAANKQQGRDDVGKLDLLIGSLRETPSFNLNLTGISFDEEEAEPETETEEEESETETGGIGVQLQGIIDQFKDPRFEVSRGDAYRLGDSYLFCEAINTGDRLWIDRLRKNPEMEFYPAASPLMVLLDRAVLVVMPDPLVASMALSMYADQHGEDQIEIL